VRVLFFLVVVVFWCGERRRSGGWYSRGREPGCSDIDLVIVGELPTIDSPETMLRRFSNRLRRANVANNVLVIGKARVPIIKFTEM
jgi:poly(A) polymerase Pap1